MGFPFFSPLRQNLQNIKSLLPQNLSISGGKAACFFLGSGRSSTRRMRELQCKTGTIWLFLRFGVISKRETILYKFHKVCAHLYSGTHSLLPLCCLYYNTLRRYERLCIIHFSTVDLADSPAVFCFIFVMKH